MSRLIRLAVDHPIWTIVITLVLAVGLAIPMFHMTQETDFREFLDDDDPIIVLLDEAEARYGKSWGIMVMLFNEDTIFNETTLTKVEQMTDAFEQLPGIKNVTTPLNSQTIVGSATSISVKKAAPGGVAPTTPEEMDIFRTRVLEDENLVGGVISESGQAALINIELEVGADDYALTPEIVEIVDSYRGDGDELYIYGDAYFDTVMAEEMESDIALLFPLAILVMVALLFASFMTIRGILVPIAIVLLSVVVAMGAMVLLGFPMTTMSFIAPILLLAIGIADAIHVLNRYNEEIAKGTPKRQAILNTMEEMKGPVVMTSLTTAAGFLSLLTAFMVPQRHFGIVTAIGVLAAMVFSLFLIPAIMSLLKEPRVRDLSKGLRPLTRVLMGFEQVIAGHRKTVLVVALIIFGVMLAGIPRLRVETSNEEFLGKDHEAVQILDFTSEYFSGDMNLLVEFDTGHRDGLKDPTVLNAMLDFETFLLENGVSKTFSLTTLVRQMNERFNADDPAFYVIPDQQNMISQLLLLFTFSGGTLGNMALGDFSAGTVMGMYKMESSGNVSRLSGVIQDYLDEHFPEGGDLRVRMIGATVLMDRMFTQMNQSQLVGLASTIAAVTVLVMILMGSVVAGLIAAIPLILTVTVSMGIMAYTGQPLDMMTLMVSVVAVGIGVDYSIHFISRFRSEYRTDQNADRALQKTIQTTGRGITYNALTVALGFFILIFASFKGIRTFGWQIALTMVVSALSAISIIPAILVQWTPKFLSRYPWKRGA
ncbi:MMPL family transporter [Candidatus Bipolaricaulota bacterium]|nr:MMPL family transporter [Candidatus Bipolaricaulota bacterium]